MWVVKIGGSWLKNPKLPSLIDFLQKFANQKIVLVVGGGVFAETVRNVYKSNKMKEETGHILAMKATEIFAYYLKSINPDISITNKITNFIKKNLNLWLPTEKLSFENKRCKNLEVKKLDFGPLLAPPERLCAPGVDFKSQGVISRRFK